MDERCYQTVRLRRDEDVGKEIKKEVYGRKISPKEMRKPTGSGARMFGINVRARETMIRGFRAGMTIARIAQMLCVTEKTIKQWCKEAREEFECWVEEYERLGELPPLDDYVGGQVMSLDDEKPFLVSLHYELEAAKADGELVNYDVIRDAATGRNRKKEVKTIRDKDGNIVSETVKTTEASDWRAASWILERRYPERYNVKRIEGQLPEDIDYETYMIAKALKSMPREELEELKALLAERCRQPQMITAGGRTVELNGGNGGSPRAHR
jgi:predicted transcriptional regulator